MHDQPWSDGCLPGWGGAADSLLMLMLDLWSVVQMSDVAGKKGRKEAMITAEGATTSTTTI
jgi:hypothetical protein